MRRILVTLILSLGLGSAALGAAVKASSDIVAKETVAVSNVSLAANTAVLGPLKLSPEDKVAFLKLPKGVQSLMIGDEKLRNKAWKVAAEKLAAASESANSGNVARDHTCDEDPRQVCVKNCTWRNSAGTCLSYGTDFCGPEAVCAENCTWRNSDGVCLNYATDYCGRDAACSPNCTWRNSDGKCLNYEADTCF